MLDTRPIRTDIGIAVILTLLTSLPISAQGIQKWKTPDGGLYFGDRPPAGSVKIGQYQEESSGTLPTQLEPNTDTSSEAIKKDEVFSARCSNRRRDIEKRLREAAGELQRIRKEIADWKATGVGGSRDRLPSASFIADVANFQDEKRQTIEDLQKQEKEKLFDLKRAWEDLGDLRAEVSQKYGELPVWWRDKISCESCPSLAEVTKALR